MIPFYAVISMILLLKRTCPTDLTSKKWTPNLSRFPMKFYQLNHLFFKREGYTHQYQSRQSAKDQGTVQRTPDKLRS